MQIWTPAERPAVPGEGDALVAAALAAVRRGLRRVVPAWGTAPAPAAATVTGSTRLVCVLGGRNAMRIPAGAAARELLLRPGICVAVARQAWNQPLHRHPHEFLTVDIGRQRIRFYRRRHLAPGQTRDEHAIAWVQRPPAEATVRLAAALEALPPEADADEARRHLVLALLAQCARELARAEGPGDARWLQASDWLRERLHLPLSRDAAAAAIGVHPNHLSRLVSRHAGIGFAAWMAARRIELAQELLRAGLPAREVAARCGFSSPSYFNAVFRRATGLSPLRWRRAAPA